MIQSLIQLRRLCFFFVSYGFILPALSPHGAERNREDSNTKEKKAEATKTSGMGAPATSPGGGSTSRPPPGGWISSWSPPSGTLPDPRGTQSRSRAGRCTRCSGPAGRPRCLRRGSARGPRGLPPRPCTSGANGVEPDAAAATTRWLAAALRPSPRHPETR